jgi:hypothetical protein
MKPAWFDIIEPWEKTLLTAQDERIDKDGDNV